MPVAPGEFVQDVVNIGSDLLIASIPLIIGVYDVYVLTHWSDYAFDAKNKLSLLPAVVVILSVYYLVDFLFLQPFIRSPLAFLPGPKIAAITDKYIMYHTWNENRNTLLKRLHSQYGPVVRIGPNEISINDARYLKDVYSGNFDKSPFYAQFGNYGYEVLFSLTEAAPHRKRRKMMAKSYSKTFIDNSVEVQRIIHDRVTRTVNFVKSNKASPVDVFDLFQAMAMDVVTAIEFGDQYSSNTVEDPASREILKSYRAQSSTWFWVCYYPRYFNLMVSATMKQHIDKVRQWHLSNVRKAVLRFYDPAEVKAGNPTAELDDLESIPVDENRVKCDPDTYSTVNTLYKNKIYAYEAAAELSDHIAAGHETTGITLAYLLYQLSLEKNAEVQKTLRDEITTFMPSMTGEAVHDAEIIEKMPFLNAVVKEILRLHPAIPGAEPRVVSSSKGLSVGSSVVPRGTCVSMQPGLLQMDSQVFPNPKSFDPYGGLGNPTRSYA